MDRYTDYNVALAFMFACAWTLSVCCSRLYLGMHTPAVSRFPYRVPALANIVEFTYFSENVHSTGYELIVSLMYSVIM